MIKRQFDAAGLLKASPSLPRPIAAPEAALTQRSPHRPLSQVVPRPGGVPCPHAQAAVLAQASGGQLARAGSSLLQLQRQFGNRYVQQVVSHARQSEPAKPAPVIQAKLVLGPANDRHEREADRVAAQVATHTSRQRTSLPRRPGQDEAASMRKPGIQRPQGAGGAVVATDVQDAIQQERGSGQPIPDQPRALMEHMFGADLSGVRVHTGTQADRLNRSLGARAFTTGKDIFFRRGLFAPASQAGQSLLAHELTHVMQQNGQTGRLQAQFWEKIGPSYTWHPEEVDLNEYEATGEQKWWSETLPAYLGNKKYAVYQKKPVAPRPKQRAKPKKPAAQAPAQKPQPPAPPAQPQPQPTVLPTPPQPTVVATQKPKAKPKVKIKPKAQPQPQPQPKAKPKPPPPPSGKPRKTQEEKRTEALQGFEREYEELRSSLEEIHNDYNASDKGDAAGTKLIQEYSEWNAKYDKLNERLNGYELRQLPPPQQFIVGMSVPESQAILEAQLRKPREDFLESTKANRSQVLAWSTQIREGKERADILGGPVPTPEDFENESDFGKRRKIFKRLVIHGIVTVEPGSREEYPDGYGPPGSYGTEFQLRGLPSGVWVLHVHWSPTRNFEKAHFKKAGFGREYKTGQASINNVEVITMSALGLLA